MRRVRLWSAWRRPDRRNSFFKATVAVKKSFDRVHWRLKSAMALVQIALHILLKAAAPEGLFLDEAHDWS
jgi:hypothetical protein